MSGDRLSAERRIVYGRHGWPKGTALERFGDKIATTGDPNDCWEWMGHSDEDGYGGYFFFEPGVRARAYRASYLLFVGNIPIGYEIDHLCRNPICVNPWHLEAVTRRENQRRSNINWAINARKTHCKRGHPFDNDNTFINARGERHCRACGRERARLYRQRRVLA